MVGRLDPDREALLVAALSSSDEFEVKRAISALAELRSPWAIDQLGALLQSQVEDIAEVAASALRTIPGVRSATALTQGLTSPSSKLRAWCAFLLGEMSLFGRRDDSLKIANSLVPLTGDSDAYVARESVHALGKIGGPVALSALEAVLANADTSIELRAIALHATRWWSENDCTAFLLRIVPIVRQYPSSLREQLMSNSRVQMARSGVMTLLEDPEAFMKDRGWHRGHDSGGPAQTYGFALKESYTVSPSSASREELMIEEPSAAAGAPGFDEGVPIDIALVTATEEEREALLSKLPEARRLPPDEEDVRVYYRCDVPTIFPDGREVSYNVVITSSLKQGRVNAANLANDVIRRWSPRYLILVGIAGGIEVNHVRLGDVILADQFIDYEHQKLTKGRRQWRFNGFQADARLVIAAQNLPKANWLQFIAVQRPQLGDPVRHIDPIATGDKLVETKSLIRALLKSYPKLIGIEMEAGGIASAAQQSSGKVGFFMVRGVSDLADPDRSSPEVESWRAYACDVAAAYTLGLIRSAPVPKQPSKQKGK